MSTASNSLQATIAHVGSVLADEAKQGYQNRAARGGIGLFTRAGLAPLRGSLPTRAADDTLARITALLGGYAALSPQERAPLLDTVLGELRDLYRLVRDLGENDPTAQPRYIGPPANRRPKPVPKPAASKPKAAIARAVTPPQPLRPESPVTDLAGVGEVSARLLGLIGVRTVGDLLKRLPRRYMDYSREYPIAHAFYGQEGTVKGTIRAIEEKRLPGKKSMVVAAIADGTGALTATWFSPYVARVLYPGAQVVLSGRFGERRGHLVLEGPEWELLDADLLHTGRIVPVYGLTKGLFQKQLRGFVSKALDACTPSLAEFVPEGVRTRAGLLPLATATRAIHFPPDDATLQAARRRLGFDEFFLLQLGMQQRKRQWQTETPGHPFAVDDAVLDRFFGVLPFALTAAQRRVLTDIVGDMRRPQAMSRLVQGDVGSGKTVVAAAAMLAAVAEGFQATLMAPTAILAEQHARTLARLFAALPEEGRPHVRLLIGSTGAKERRAIAAGLADGTIDILVGTQAIIQAGVEFARLGFATVDEQHRFGVIQRATLRSKGHNPDLLVMTATPIPRSLALTLHGDLDVSVIDELPPGRQAIITRAGGPDDRPREYEAIRAEVQIGAAGVRDLPAGRGVGADRGEGRDRGVGAAANRGLPRSARGPPARADAPGGEGPRDGRVSRPRVRYPRLDGGDRGGDRHPQRLDHADRRGEPLRPVAAPPVSRARRARRGAVLLAS